MDEQRRIAYLVERDGREAAVDWVRRTRDLYARALAEPSHFAAQAAWRPRFEAAVREFDAWLSAQGPP